MGALGGAGGGGDDFKLPVVWNQLVLVRYRREYTAIVCHVVQCSCYVLAVGVGWWHTHTQFWRAGGAEGDPPFLPDGIDIIQAASKRASELSSPFSFSILPPPVWSTWNSSSQFPLFHGTRRRQQHLCGTVLAAIIITRLTGRFSDGDEREPLYVHPDEPQR